MERLLLNENVEAMMMTAILAIGVGMIMTAIAVAIGGLALKIVLIALNRALAMPTVNPATEQISHQAAIIQFEKPVNAIGTMEWAEEAAA